GLVGRASKTRPDLLLLSLRRHRPPPLRWYVGLSPRHPSELWVAGGGANSVRDRFAQGLGSPSKSGVRIASRGSVVRIVTGTRSAFTSPNRVLGGLARWEFVLVRMPPSWPASSSASTSPRTTSRPASAPPTSAGRSPTPPPALPTSWPGRGPTP